MIHWSCYLESKVISCFSDANGRGKSDLLCESTYAAASEQGAGAKTDLS
jgi:hypothetical protein